MTIVEYSRPDAIIAILFLFLIYGVGFITGYVFKSFLAFKRKGKYGK